MVDVFAMKIPLFQKKLPLFIKDRAVVKSGFSWKDLTENIVLLSSILSASI